MTKYLGSNIESVLYTHFKIDTTTGDVTERFGWTNTGIDSIGEALYTGLDIAMANAEAMRVEVNRAASYHRRFKFRRMTDAEKIAADGHDNIARAMAERMVGIQNILNMFKTHPWKSTSDVECRVNLARKFIDVTLLDRDAEYEVRPLLIGWQDKANVFYHVEADFTISEWRLAAMGYTNHEDGSISLRYNLFRGPHYDGNGKLPDVIDEGNGVWCEGECYFTKRSDAVAHAEERIKIEQVHLEKMLEELRNKQVA